MNGHSTCWCKFLNVGKETGQEDRIRHNFENENPPLAGHRTLRKDHKEGFDPVQGPPGRPLCSADNSYNQSMSIQPVLREMLDKEITVCENTEDMLATFRQVNENAGLPVNTTILSADVKALYPSLDIEFTTDVVCDMFESSDLNIEGIDYEELGLYLAINYTRDKLFELGIQDYCTTRKFTRGQKPKITGNGSEVTRTKRFEPWNMPAKKITTEDGGIKKKMIKEALRIAIKFIMKNHVYTFDNKIHKQEQGGAIGVELTGDLAQVFMVWWTRQLQGKTQEKNITMYLNKTYVDDINMVVNIPEEVEVEELNIDERAIQSVQTIKVIGNSIHESIQLETDCPENHEDKKLPILDLKVWLKQRNDRKFIMHEYYMKPVSSIALIDARSTLPWKSKRTILVQQAIRILRNCSEDLPWEIKKKHLNHMMKRMQYSGYNQKFRYEVLNSALHAFEEMKKKDESGEQPLYRSKHWRRKERRAAKEEKRKNWYKRGGYESVIFVPSTKESTLLKQLQANIDKSKLKIKLIEKSGTSLGDILRTADPRKEKNCNRGDCPICTKGGKGNCRTLNINYKITCECNDEYNGTTTRSGYTRGIEHTEDMISKKEDSDMWRHCRDKHNGEIKGFRMDIVDTFKNDPMLRQVTEAVRIRRTEPEKRINRKEENRGSR